jgi:two-component system, OmpR family, heavy metal sensor histidine kinase CusS
MRALSVCAKLMILYLIVTLAGLFIFGIMSFGALQYASFQGKRTHLQGREDRLLSLLKENKDKGVTGPLIAQLQDFALATHEGNLFHIHNPDGSMIFPANASSNDWPALRSTIASSQSSAHGSSINNRSWSCVITSC